MSDVAHDLVAGATFATTVIVVLGAVVPIVDAEIYPPGGPVGRVVGVAVAWLVTFVCVLAATAVIQWVSRWTPLPPVVPRDGGDER